MDEMVEDARIRLGIDRLPAQVKCVKKLNSRDQTPEAIEKGILRAKHELPVFRDGTVRYDMETCRPPISRRERLACRGRPCTGWATPMTTEVRR